MIHKKSFTACLLSTIMILTTVIGPTVLYAEEAAPGQDDPAAFAIESTDGASGEIPGDVFDDISGGTSNEIPGDVSDDISNNTSDGASSNAAIESLDGISVETSGDMSDEELNASPDSAPLFYNAMDGSATQTISGISIDQILLSQPIMTINGQDNHYLRLNKFLEKVGITIPADACKIELTAPDGTFVRLTPYQLSLYFFYEKGNGLYYITTADQYPTVYEVKTITVLPHYYSPDRDYNKVPFGWVCTRNSCGVKAPQNRCWGMNRYKTSLAAAEFYQLDSSYCSGDSTQYFYMRGVVLASGKNFPDALSGGALAIAKNMPLVIVDSHTVDEVLSKITLYLSESDRPIYILGGTNAIGNNLDSYLRNKGYTNIRRLYGNSRYETNLKILDEIMSTSSTAPNTLLISSGKNYADSLSASSTGLPILLVGDSLTNAQKTWLRKNSFKNYVILGGMSAVSAATEIAITETINRPVTIRLGGDNRYETSANIARYFFKEPYSAIFSSSKMMVLAYGRNFADALVAGPLAYKYHSPVVLVTNDNYQAAKNLSMVYDGVLTMGGASLISDQTVSRIIGVG